MDLTVREAARRAGRTEETIRRWIWSGRLPANKIGNTYRMSAADLDAASRGIPLPRAADDEGSTQPDLGEWFKQVRDWQASNEVDKRPGAWRLVIEGRIGRAEPSGR